jgi:short-subunit dehydrogenase
MGPGADIPLGIIGKARIVSALIFGGSAGLGRALARELASRKHDILLVARDSRDLEAEAAHLRNVYGVSVEWMAVDAGTPEAAQKLAGLTGLSSVRHIFFPIGMTHDGDDGLLPPMTASALVNANLTSIIMTISLLLPGLLAADSGNIVGIGSVAAIRGRSSNIVYAATKRGLESYFESLRHRTASSRIRVQFYRLGYVDTQMSYGKKLPFPKIAPQKVVEIIVRNLGKDLGCLTIPSFWLAIGYAVRILPWRIYRRLHF